jgi:sulfide dehydrogenase cytochrome subunit
MTAARSCLAAFLIMSSVGAASGAEAPAGAVACTGCHAAIARTETAVPPLNGRPAADIASAMAAFKSGERKGTIMDRIAKGFSEPETLAIAQWYAQQK